MGYTSPEAAIMLHRTPMPHESDGGPSTGVEIQFHVLASHWRAQTGNERGRIRECASQQGGIRPETGRASTHRAQRTSRGSMA